VARPCARAALAAWYEARAQQLKPCIDPGVHVHLGRLAGHRRAHALHRVQRNVVVVLGVVELHRAVDGRGAVQLGVDAAAVEGHRGGHVGAGRCQVGETAAHAVTEGADLARADFGPRAQRGHCGGDVGHGVGGVQALHQRHGACALVAHVAQFDAR
jgi:hypothetical protein